MLKSTYQGQKSSSTPPPLPAGWSEHTAPTGHSYYYNAETKQSTYTRPQAQSLSSSYTNSSSANFGDASNHGNWPILVHGSDTGPSDVQSSHSFRAGQDRVGWRNRDSIGSRNDSFNPPRRRHPRDRPKSKHVLPDCEPWLLIKTKLGRRFVYNPEQRESFWRVPLEVQKSLEEFDRVEKEGLSSGAPAKSQEIAAKTSTSLISTEDVDFEEDTAVSRAIPAIEEDSDEYEEVEVTDDEDEDHPRKRQKTEDVEEDKPIEFNEDDIAYQLAAMGQDYGLDPGEYGGEEGEEEWEEGAGGLELTEEDATNLFKDLLDDMQVNPFKPWDQIIEEGLIIDDDRYTVLPNMKSRKKVWTDWSRERVDKLREKRKNESQEDPRLPYLVFVQKHGTTKLYWPEFKRKFKKEPEMRDSKLLNKDREKWYRDYVSRLKLPESKLKSDLADMLKSFPLTMLNRFTDPAQLPSVILTDLRYLGLKPSIRDPLVETYISTLPPPPEGSNTLDNGDEDEMRKKHEDRQRREAALEERERRVSLEKRKQQGAMDWSREQLRNEEEEVERAKRVGKEGLKGQLRESSNLE